MVASEVRSRHEFTRNSDEKDGPPANKAMTKAEGSCDTDLCYCLQGLGKQNIFSLIAAPVFSILELLK